MVNRRGGEYVEGRTETRAKGRENLGLGFAWASTWRERNSRIMRSWNKFFWCYEVT